MLQPAFKATVRTGLSHSPFGRRRLSLALDSRVRPGCPTTGRGPRAGGLPAPSPFLVGAPGEPAAPYAQDRDRFPRGRESAQGSLDHLARASSRRLQIADP